MNPNINYSEVIFDKYIYALREYTGLSLDEIVKKGQCEQEFKNQFTSDIIIDPEKTRYEYEQSDVYMFAHPFYYKDNFVKRFERFWKPILKNPGSVLDYGCGVATIDELLLQIGIKDITLCDLHSPTWKFIKWFFDDRVKYEEDVDSLVGKYDWIISNSVLEHIHDPLRVVNMWGEHLTPRGQIIDSMATDVGEPHLQVAISQYKNVIALIDEINKNHQ